MHAYSSNGDGHFAAAGVESDKLVEAMVVELQLSRLQRVRCGAAARDSELLFLETRKLLDLIKSNGLIALLQARRLIQAHGSLAPD